MKDPSFRSFQGFLAAAQIRQLDRAAKGDYIAASSSDLWRSGGKSLWSAMFYSGVSGDTRSNLA